MPAVPRETLARETLGKVPAITLGFWIIRILATTPLGAVVGDFLDKPVADGGLALSRYTATACLLAAIMALVWLLPQRAAARAH